MNESKMFATMFYIRVTNPSQLVIAARSFKCSANGVTGRIKDKFAIDAVVSPCWALQSTLAAVTESKTVAVLVATVVALSDMLLPPFFLLLDHIDNFWFYNAKLHRNLPGSENWTGHCLLLPSSPSWP